MTPAKSASATRYVILTNGLEERDEDSWVHRGLVSARSPEAALEEFRARNPAKWRSDVWRNAQFAAVPYRFWRPRKLELELVEVYRFRPVDRAAEPKLEAQAE